MESGDELHEDEEEILVYVEFEDFANSNVFNDKDLQLDMVGLDTDHPVMQVNGKFFEGVYEDAIGTCMFFEPDTELPVEDPVFDKSGSVKYFAKTKKILKMQRVFVQPRTEVFGDSEHPESIPNMNVIKEAGVPPKYQKEALSFWEKVRDDRISAVNAYLEKQRIREEKRLQGLTLDSDSDEDNPFAIYKEQMTGNTEMSKYLMEGAEMNISKSNVDVDSQFKKILKDDLSESLKSETVAAKPKASTSKDIKKRRSKKSKSDNSVILGEERVELNLESNKEQAHPQLTEQNKKDNNEENISNTVIDINEIANNTVLSDKDTNFLQTEISLEDKTDEIIQQSKKINKLKKREAKMEELSQRLKTMAVDGCIQNK